MKYEILVVIPTYGHFDYAAATLKSLRDGGLAIGGIVVDDASPEWMQQSDKLAGAAAHIHFEQRAGLTRSWNSGIALALSLSPTYIACANSDLIFAPKSCEAMVRALHSGFDIVGPLTNAPGHCDAQNITTYLEDVTRLRTDDPNDIAEIAVRARSIIPHSVSSPINGFCMMATASFWREAEYLPGVCFNPSYPMAGNEDEFQARIAEKGARVGISLNSYVFHYRSISRGDQGLKGRLAQGAFRPLPN